MEQHKVDRRRAPKFEWRVGALLLTALAWMPPASAKEWTATFFLQELPNTSLTVAHLSGIIDQKTASDANSILKNPGNRLVSVMLNSPGGDVEAAMSIGRLLRAKHMRATVRNRDICASACVLVLAGATRRTMIGPVLIHRPYFSASAASPTYSEIQAHYQSIRSDVRSYLLEMNVSPNLWDAMVATSPNDARQLSATELKEFGLLDTDPVEDELRRQSTAKAFGITSAEVLRRQALIEQYCVLNFDENTPESEVSKAMLAHDQCKSRIMKGEK